MVKLISLLLFIPELSSGQADFDKSANEEISVEENSMIFTNRLGSFGSKKAMGS